MWSDELDKKLWDAADQPSPAFDEKAWDKMHAILEKELPQKKKDRRRILLLLFLVLGGGAFLIIRQDGNTNITPQQTVNSTAKNSKAKDA